MRQVSVAPIDVYILAIPHQETTTLYLGIPVDLRLCSVVGVHRGDKVVVVKAS